MANTGQSLFFKFATLFFGLAFTLASCSDDESEGLIPPTPSENDQLKASYTTDRSKVLKIGTTDKFESYVWTVTDVAGKDSIISQSDTLTYLSAKTGTLNVKLTAIMGNVTYTYTTEIKTQKESEAYNLYQTKVIDLLVAPGQFVNENNQYGAFYEEGDTKASILAKANENYIGKDSKLISLGGFGGYIIVGFDHTIVNSNDPYHFKITGNAFANFAEPGVVMVAYDKNANGKPDDDEWYELAGSEYANSIKNYEITYTKPNPLNADVPWTDNQGNSGIVKRNSFHNQASYFPLWAGTDKITFKGTLLPNQKSGNVAFEYGYADNQPTSDSFNINWAVDANGNKVVLPGVDFIKVYTGQNKDGGIFGEISTEFKNVMDLTLED